MALYPVNFNLDGKCCLIIGGGKVALRKVCGLCRAGAKVQIISPQLVTGLQKLVVREGIKWHAREFIAGDLQGAFLVFAATSSPSVQQQIREEAQRAGVLVNLADSPSESDFHVPGHFRRGDVLVTVATGGKSPAITAKLRRELEENLHPGYGEVVRFFGLLRERVLRNDNDSAAHGRLFHKLLEDGMVELILGGDWEAVSLLLNAYLPQEIDGRRLIREFLSGQDCLSEKDNLE